MSRSGYAAGIFLLTISVRGFLLSRTPPADFLFGDQTAAGLWSILLGSVLVIHPLVYYTGSIRTVT
jgi:hypothetical protein